MADDNLVFGVVVQARVIVREVSDVFELRPPGVAFAVQRGEDALAAHVDLQLKNRGSARESMLGRRSQYREARHDPV